MADSVLSPEGAVLARERVESMHDNDEFAVVL